MPDTATPPEHLGDTMRALLHRRMQEVLDTVERLESADEGCMDTSPQAEIHAAERLESVTRFWYGLRSDLRQWAQQYGRRPVHDAALAWATTPGTRAVVLGLLD